MDVFQFKSVTKFSCRHVSQTLKCADTEPENFNLTGLQGETITLDARNRHSRTRGPGTRAARVLRAMTTIQAINANATSVTHSYIAMSCTWSPCTPKGKGIIYSRQHYLSDFFDPQSSQSTVSFAKPGLHTQSERILRLFALHLTLGLAVFHEKS